MSDFRFAELEANAVVTNDDDMDKEVDENQEDTEANDNATNNDDVDKEADGKQEDIEAEGVEVKEKEATSAVNVSESLLHV